MAQIVKEYEPKDDERCDCGKCKRKNCQHRGAYRRRPREEGGLGLCPNLEY